MTKTFKISLDFVVCKGCGYCLEICPQNVFDPGHRRNDKGHHPPLAARIEDCIGCLRCRYACPDFCLEVSSTSAAGAIS